MLIFLAFIDIDIISPYVNDPKKRHPLWMALS